MASIVSLGSFVQRVFEETQTDFTELQSIDIKKMLFASIYKGADGKTEERLSLISNGVFLNYATKIAKLVDDNVYVEDEDIKLGQSFNYRLKEQMRALGLIDKENLRLIE